MVKIILRESGLINSCIKKELVNSGMIKANELRIGNRIKYNNDKSLRDELINKEVIVTADVIKWASNPSENCYEPIPLTPEILERCGFEKKEEDGVITFTLEIKGIADHGDNEYKLFGIKSKPAFVQIDYTVNRYWAAKPIYYLHQLQNIYNALTGEELEIKELEHA